MKIRTADLFYFLFLFLLSGLFFWRMNFSIDFVGFSFFILTMESVFFLSFIGGKYVSMGRVYFLFSLIFFSIIPWLHYSNDIILWDGEKFSDADYVMANILIFLSGALVAAVYFFEIRRDGCKGSEGFSKNSTEYINVGFLKFVLFTLSLLSFFVLLYLNDYSVMKLLLRGFIDEGVADTGVDSSALLLVLTMTSRMIPFFVFVFAITEIKRSRVFKLVLFLILFICVFPTGVPRYLVGFVYIPLLLMFFRGMRGAVIFPSFLLGAIFLVFPFLNQFRSADISSGIKFFPSIEFFLAAHFDAYQNFARVVQNDLVTLGYQLLGVLFFYVPRSVWSSKPVGSGYEMSVQLNYPFNNISMPYLGEAYINFGIIGVVLFSVIIAYFMANLDRRFYVQISIFGNVRYSGAVYFYILGALFFLLRGDMLSSVAYVTSGLFSAFFVNYLGGFFRKSNVKYSA